MSKPDYIKTEYYGTSLTEIGHYIHSLGVYGLDLERNINVSKYPFDIYSFSKNTEKGTVIKSEIKNFKIISITGSCIDKRGGTVSVFITNDNVSLDQFEEYIKNHPYCKRMFDQMSFNVLWQENKINLDLPKELLEWLKESYKSVSFGREPIKISKYGGSFFVKFSDNETYKISLQLHKSQTTLD